MISKSERKVQVSVKVAHYIPVDVPCGRAPLAGCEFLAGGDMLGSEMPTLLQSLRVSPLSKWYNLPSGVVGLGVDSFAILSHRFVNILE